MEESPTNALVGVDSPWPSSFVSNIFQISDYHECCVVDVTTCGFMCFFFDF